MFGYIIVNQQELKFKEYDRYRSYYCGLCRRLKEKYGRTGQFTLSYDTTFLILLLSGLYEPEEETRTSRCIAHPFCLHEERVNRFTDYAADVNLILSYYSSQDDWSDEHKVSKLLLSGLLREGSEQASGKLDRKAEVIRDGLSRLGALEKENSENLDEVSGCFGQIMAEIFAYKEDEWTIPLRQMGFYLGKFIYLLDAVDDLKKDMKSGSYNPLKSRYIAAGGAVKPAYGNAAGQNIAPGSPLALFYGECEDLLRMMMAECCRAFEVLPVVENASILRNILYSGVWAGFRRQQNPEGKTDD